MDPSPVWALVRVAAMLDGWPRRSRRAPTAPALQPYGRGRYARRSGGLTAAPAPPATGQPGRARKPPSLQTPQRGDDTSPRPARLLVNTRRWLLLSRSHQTGGIAAGANVVFGGGVMGCSIAFHLAERG